MLCKKTCLKILQNSQEKTWPGDSFLTKLQAVDLQIYWKETPTKVLSCKFYKIFKNTYFAAYLWTAAFEYFLGFRYLYDDAGDFH